MLRFFDAVEIILVADRFERFFTHFGSPIFFDDVRVGYHVVVDMDKWWQGVARMQHASLI